MHAVVCSLARSSPPRTLAKRDVQPWAAHQSHPATHFRLPPLVESLSHHSIIPNTARFKSNQPYQIMPRDLAALVKGNADSEPAAPEGIMFGAQAAHDEEVSSKRNEVHPYTQTLTLSDVDSCVILEDLAFPPNERASRAKVSLEFACLPACSEVAPLPPIHHPRPCLASLLPTSRCHSASCMRWHSPPSALLSCLQVEPSQGYPPGSRT